MTDETTQSIPAPPYIAFTSLKTFISGLKEHGVPSRIDRSIMTNFSGAVAGQIITSLRFLRLITADNEPSTMLGDLVRAYNSPAWKEAVAKMLREAYVPLFRMNLQNATPSLFNEEFKKHYGGADAVIRKCMTFFLNACREADVQISPRLLSGTKPRTAIAKRKTKPANKTHKDGEQHNPPPPSGNNGTGFISKSASQIVFEAFDPSNMPPEVQKATLELLTWLKANGK